MSSNELEGFEELSDLLKKYEDKISEDTVLEVLEESAKSLATDVRALPRPRSRVRSTGYTHLLNTVTHKTEAGEVVVGWGKYYGPMVERGTNKMNGVPHLAPTFERNKERYYKQMQEKLFE